MSPISKDDADAIERRKNRDKPRSKGTLPYLPDGDWEAESLREWLTRAFRPPKGWTVQSFERTGRNKPDPCSITVRNGRELKTYRFSRQGDLYGGKLRSVVLAVSDGKLKMPHLTPGEQEDVWAALCALGSVLTEHDEVDEVREWVEALLGATLPLYGHTLVPDGRHEALMAIRAAGEFTRADALSLIRGGDDRWQQRPVRFVDKQTGEQWLRAGETAAYIRFVLGVEPLSYSTLRARLQEIGVVGRPFEDYRPPHPKLTLYQLTESLVEYVEGRS